MPNTRRFEGPDIETVLADIERELGARAQIVKAHKVRSGGVAGFFARERCEIEVAVDEDATAADIAMTAVSATPPTPPTPLTPQTPPTAPTPAPAAVPSPPAERAPITTILDLVEDVSLAERRVNRDADRPVPERAGPVTPRRGRERTFAEVLADLRDVAKGDGSDVAEDRRAAAAPPRPAPAAPAAPVAPAVVPAAPSAAPAVPAVASSVAPPPPVARSSSVAPALARLGLPATLRPVDAKDSGESLLLRLRALPAPPALPTRPGTVVAVVGPRKDALGVAAKLNAPYGAGAHRLVVATRSSASSGASAQCLRTPADVAGERRSWRRRRFPTFVVVDAQLGDTAFAEETLQVLEAGMEWGVVDATSKVGDVAAWVDCLGGVDVLALVGTHRTVTPAEILGLGVAVGMIDGEPATAERWASLLMHRIEGRGAPDGVREEFLTAEEA